jgi:CheY-like chemotaxis protein
MNKLTYIDDCQLDHFILKKILSRFGSPCEVKCTATGNEALNLLMRYRYEKDKLPDMILLDIYMPEFDCWNFLENVQTLNPTLAKPIEIYILSASNYPDDIERAGQYPCVKAFILKPITREVLEKLFKQKGVPLGRLNTLEAKN